jgi:phosphohistidine phosphatase SixA
VLVAALALVLAAGVGGGIARAQSLTGAALVAALRQGGYVLVMRHASSPSAPPAADAAARDNRNLERELDAQGRASARAMGEAFRRLGIPVGVVASSPTYRALQTVRFAGLRHARAVPELGDGGQGMQAPAEQSRAAWLRSQVAAAPGAGTNVLLVTHAPNIVGAFAERARDIGDGEIMVFRPDGRGSADLVARVPIGQWPALARAR